ncbi:MAG: hypothetical protein M3220_13785 [Chloroflexota bacterium]|nr:hypothetical protein [Chloroflexota bacterium]
MKRRIAARVAWLLWFCTTALATVGLLLKVHYGNATLVDLVFVLAVESVHIVGALIAARRPEHLVGWIFSVMGITSAIGLFVEGYQMQINQMGILLPGSIVLFWFLAQSWVLFFGLIAALFFTFPTGQLPTPRWRYAAGLTALSFLLTLFSTAFKPGPLPLPEAAGPSTAPLLNPLAVHGSAAEVLEQVETIGGYSLLFGIMAAVTALLMRFRRSRGIERQQLKWFTSGATLFAIVMTLNVLLRNSESGIPFEIVDVITGLSFTAIPISAGIAILKYRLYDIDLIIRRTLIYSLLTAALALTYLGTVVLLQQLFRSLTGHDSNAAIVISTLAIAALFNPLRQRIQEFIDRRFYRRKYDAQQTLAAFGQTVRNEVELDKLTGELLRVIEETMQPAHVSLWLRSDAPSPSEDIGNGKRLP